MVGETFTFPTTCKYTGGGQRKTGDGSGVGEWGIKLKPKADFFQAKVINLESKGNLRTSISL